MTWLIILASILVPLFLIGLQVDDWTRDWTKNHAALEAAASNPDLRPQKFDEPPPTVHERITRWVESRPEWSMGNSETENGLVTVSLTRTSKIFRFVDDVSVTLTPTEDDDGTIMTAESQSRVGKGDLGQNPRNLIALVRGVRETVALPEGRPANLPL